MTLILCLARHRDGSLGIDGILEGPDVHGTPVYARPPGGRPSSLVANRFLGGELRRQLRRVPARHDLQNRWSRTAHRDVTELGGLDLPSRPVLADHFSKRYGLRRP